MRSKLLIVVVIVMQLGCQKETIINSTIYIDVEVSSAGIDSIPHHLTIDEIKRLNVEVQKKYIVNPYKIVSINTNKIDAIYLPITFKELRLISDKIKKSKGPVVMLFKAKKIIELKGTTFAVGDIKEKGSVR